MQAASICEGYANRQYLKKHPKETLEDVYTDYEKVKYRNIVMCPGHLVEKWKAELEEELPFVSVKILKEFSELVELRNRGRERTGKEFYIMSKDFAKLSYMQRPVPHQVKQSWPVYYKQCQDCNSELLPFEGKCSSCGSEKLIISKKVLTKGKGLICPDCGNLLPAGVNKEGEFLFLSPKDFATPTTANQRCRYCNANLWEPFVRNIDIGLPLKRTPSKWKRASHYANANQRAIKSVWVLDKYEKSYFRSVGKRPLDIKENLVGIRKYSPAQFIKKYMKDFFDMAVFDEAHLYKGGSTGQGNAMAALIKSSKKQLALTGTIAGGKADHLFYMLFRLDPRRMQKYGWKGVLKFAEEYGSVERLYEVEEGNERMSTYVRGRQIGSPKTKPGISPRIFTDFLLDRAVFLDLDDMSKYMPAFKEIVVTVPMDRKIYFAYEAVLNFLGEAGRKNMAVLSQKLQFGLSFPDKPFTSRKEFIHPKTGEAICQIPNFSSYWEDDSLLPKEEKLLELLEKELSEGRNCVVFAEFTASEDTCVTGRLKAIIEKKLKVKTEVLLSSTPPPLEREQWLHTQAEKGVQVFIMNPKCVETGRALASAA